MRPEQLINPQPVPELGSEGPQDSAPEMTANPAFSILSEYDIHFLIDNHACIAAKANAKLPDWSQEQGIPRHTPTEILIQALLPHLVAQRPQGFAIHGIAPGYHADEHPNITTRQQVTEVFDKLQDSSPSLLGIRLSDIADSEVQTDSEQPSSIASDPSAPWNTKPPLLIILVLQHIPTSYQHIFHHINLASHGHHHREIIVQILQVGDDVECTRWLEACQNGETIGAGFYSLKGGNGADWGELPASARGIMGIAPATAMKRMDADGVIAMMVGSIHRIQIELRREAKRLTMTPRLV